MRMRPVSPENLVRELVEVILAPVPPGRLQAPAVLTRRIAVDGADAACPAELADALVEPLREHGRPALRARAEDHLRPASLRFERGRTDPDSFYADWLDEEGLRRELLGPLGPGGSGRIRTARWDATRDRAVRSGFIEVPDRAVLILSGPLLLGRGLPLDLTVHLDLSAPALARRTPAESAWTLPAYERYAVEVSPATVADVVVRVDDPRHPAVLMTDGTP
ncbi:MAG TPA: uridine kinase [Micromonosporaceae bacterium]